MPKAKTVTKIEGHTIITRTPVKFRIGTRRSGKSANLFSTEELSAIVADKNKSKFHNNARAVLGRRECTIQ